MRIWLVSIFEQLPIDNVFSTRFISIADEAVKRGHEVVFFASTFKHNTKNQRFEDTTVVDYKPNYKIVLVKSQGYEKNISPRRMWSHYAFSKNLVKELANYPKPDVILVAFPPVSVAYKISQWGKSNNVPVVMDIIDPWPDLFAKAIPEKMRFAEGALLYPMRKRLKDTLQSISALTAISNQYLNWASNYYDRIPLKACMYPASDLNQIQAEIIKSKEGLQEARGTKSLTVIYAGSLASSYDIPCILKAAHLLANKHPGIKFKIAGAGPQDQMITKYCDEHKNLEFLGRLTKGELMKQYATADLGLTQHIKGATQSVTYKLFDLLSAGLPILNSLESEMKDIIVNNRVGLHNAPGDYEQLAANIEHFFLNPGVLQEFKENGFKLTKEQGDSLVVYGKFVDLLESIVK